MTIQLRAYDEYEKRMKDVGFTIQRNNQKFSSRTERKGLFQFFIQPEDSLIVVTAHKENYKSKTLYFPAKDYNFSKKYAVQEIDLMFDKGSKDEVQKGQLLFRNAKYIVEALEEEDPYKKKEPAEDTLENNIEETITSIDSSAVDIAETNPDFIATADSVNSDSVDQYQQEFDFEKSEVKEYFSVQIGAFSKKVRTNAFSMVPEFRIVNDVDFNRCFSGKFQSRAGAEQRLEELIELGFIDAFVVRFKGNERILF
jgi:hypothetical protein